MSDEKITVKDLATTLGVAPKDILRVLRELDIPARSTVSPIPVDDVSRVKERFAGGQTGAEQRREIQPGVIVRRRRHAESAEAAPVEARTAEPGEAGSEAAPKDAGRTAGQAAGQTPGQTPEAPEVQPVEAAPEEAKAAAPKTRKRSSRPETAARIIQRPDEPVAEEKPAEPAPATEAAPLPIIDKDTARAKAGSAGSKVRQPKTETVSAETAEEPASPAVEAEPKTEEAAEAESGKPRRAPAASAVPEGSSAPSLLPPPGEGRMHDDGDGFALGDEPRRRAESAPTSQVRIISRPDPAAPREAAPDRSGRPAPRDGFRPGGPRPSGGAPSGRPGMPGSRPGMPSMPGARPGMPPMPEENQGQSKKKRNKNQNRRPGDAADFAPSRRTGDDEGDMPRMRGARRRPKKDRQQPQATQPLKAAKRKIRIEEAIRVADMAHQMGLKSGEIIKVLFNLGIMATINKALDIDTAAVVAAEFGYEVEKVGFAEEDYLVSVAADEPEQLKLRPPVVTIMGHVDHGKTSLLDAIRKTHVTEGEAGGITQHIGAYHVTTKRGEIVFLDTPGHEAFTAMRARGAQVTDLVVLVVAADDGVMEQTREAINHAKAAGVPIMVAVNKIDKEGANPDRVLRELAELGLQSESWGGDTITAFVSAKTREGLDDLLELIALQADILELKANPDKPARGHIVEAKLDKGRGPVATVLIQEGTLHQGDTFVCGVFSGRVRAMFNDQGRKVKEAGPSIPVEVQGFDGVPEAGEEFICLADEKLARRIAETRAVKQRERELAKESRVTLETFLSRSPDDEQAKVLNLVLKADVQGSLEAITEAVRKLSTDKVHINVIHGGAGAITESDILLATASDAIVIGFNVRPTAKVKDMAEQENVDIRFYDIIYKLVDEIKSAMAGMLAPVQREVYLGQAEVREVFSVPRIGAIAGSHVSDGKITRNAGVRLLRDGVVVYTGKVASLRRFKDDVREVLKGYECGIGLENFNDVKIGDIIEAFETVEEAATL